MTVNTIQRVIKAGCLESFKKHYNPLFRGILLLTEAKQH